MNLEEASFFNEGPMTLDGALDLSPLVEHPMLKGKDHCCHGRHAQHKVTEGKLREQATSGLRYRVWWQGRSTTRRST